jgi:cellulose synthase/poly-beta-1,6-N-acetylglucosamine synthase-like glycosyltransferase
MNTLIQIFLLTWVMLDVFFIFIFLYFTAFHLLGLFLPFKCKLPSFRTDKKTRSFVLIICAHNEEAVIGNTLEHMLKVDYPVKYLKVLVIADNCTDGTARAARHYQAVYPNYITVLERKHAVLRGKPHAVKYALDWVDLNLPDTEVISIADADNIYHPNFFNVMNRHINSGSEIVQGYLGIKNPYDNALTTANTLAYRAGARTYFNVRRWLGMSTGLGGTGFVVTRKIIKKLVWDMTSLTEDLEFSVKAVLNGYQVDFAPNAITYDEKPTERRASVKQRTRWMQGHYDICIRYTLPLMSALFRRKKLTVSGRKPRRRDIIDYLLYVTAPPRFMLQMYVIVSSFALLFFVRLEGYERPWFDVSMSARIVMLIVNLIFYTISAPLSGVPLKHYKGMLYSSTIYMYGWYEATLKATFKFKSKVWDKTVHKVEVAST